MQAVAHNEGIALRREDLDRVDSEGFMVDPVDLDDGHVVTVN